MKRWSASRHGVGLALTLGLLGSMTVQAPASATHPGANGKIAFWVFNAGRIQAVEPDGSSRSLIAGGHGSFQAPAWSPDGTQIAYSSGGERLVVADADGSNAKRIVGPDDGIKWLVSPSWSDDGTQIAALCHVKGSKGGRVTIITLADGTFTQIGPRSIIPFDGLDWSPTGTIAFMTGYSAKLHMIQPDGSGSDTVHGTYLFDPSWSPDGSRLAVAHYLDTGRTDIVTMDPDGSHRVRVTSTPGRWEWTPAWSPDGTMIAFSRTQTSDDSAPDDVWVAAADGSGVQQIVDTPKRDEFSLDWQPI